MFHKSQNFFILFAVVIAFFSILIFFADSFNVGEALSVIPRRSLYTSECVASYYCVNESTRAYRDSQCQVFNLGVCMAGVCQNGQCVPICTDSDEGENIFVQGTMTSVSGVQSIDFCSSDLSVNEYSCSSEASSYLGTCPEGFECMNGECRYYARADCGNDLDSDGDGLCNTFELSNALHPYLVDSDFDKIPDSDEDSDGDGFVELVEARGGTNPSLATDFPITPEIPLVIAHSGNYIDGNLVPDGAWNAFLSTSQKLRDLGFTHLGIKIWSKEAYPELKRERLSQLRASGYKIALTYNFGLQFIEPTNILDQNKHYSNGQNLKYFGSFGFNALDCSACGCIDPPHRVAHDPAYTGSVWRDELSHFSGVVESAELAQGDIVMVDAETWGPMASNLTNCYPDAFGDGGGRYFGAPSERAAQYFIYIRNRGNELAEIAKSDPSNPFFLFFNDRLPAFYDVEGTSMPAGVGDALNQPFYRMTNLSPLKLDLGVTCNNNYAGFKCDRQAQRDFSNSYAWIIISHVKRNSVYLREHISSSVLATAGKLFHDEGVKGLIFWPEPGIMKYGDAYLVDKYYVSRASSILSGYYGGSQGALSETCGDDIDNDGDFYCDEANAGCTNVADCDGLPDWWENYYGLNPSNRDSDNDYISDGWEDPDNDLFLNLDEYYQGTDPMNPDSDRDGALDRFEHCARIAYPVNEGENCG